MGQFTVIPQNTFNSLQLDAGVLLKSFNPASPSVQDSDIICATTGGINAVCQPTYTDFGEDVDNCPNNMKELNKTLAAYQRLAEVVLHPKEFEKTPKRSIKRYLYDQTLLNR